MATKDFSSIQEHKIAHFLNWRVVSGSGARNFYPGDIESDMWLGECKTHVSEQSKIVFKKDFWIKICNEADSKFKRPVLIVDDGTQNLMHTWCMIRSSLVPDIQKFDFPFKVRTNVTVDKCELSVNWSEMSRNTDDLVFAYQLQFNSENVCILHLIEFGHLFSEVY